MNQVEVEDSGKTTNLDAIGTVASGDFLRKGLLRTETNEIIVAPLGFSYACGGSFLFRKDSISLLLNTIQVCLSRYFCRIDNVDSGKTFISIIRFSRFFKAKISSVKLTTALEQCRQRFSQESLLLAFSASFSPLLWSQFWTSSHQTSSKVVAQNNWHSLFKNKQNIRNPKMKITTSTHVKRKEKQIKCLS